MKKYFFFGILILFICISSSAQTKASQTVTIKTPTVLCEMSKTQIEQYLKRMDGVTFVNVKYKQKQVLVKYLTDRTNEENIKAGITNSGYDANEISANPEAYKMLPKCCKKPEDGGIKPKKS